MLDAATERKWATFTPLSSPFTGAGQPGTHALRTTAASPTDELLAAHRDLHAHPEEAWQEHRSANALIDLLGRHGIEASIGWNDVSTAFQPT